MGSTSEGWRGGRGEEQFGKCFTFLGIVCRVMRGAKLICEFERGHPGLASICGRVSGVLVCGPDIPF